MQIEHHPPAARGVSTLMYVGDDEAVDRAVATPTPLELGIGAAGVALALCGKGAARSLGAIAAAVVGLRYIRAR